jgi:hypothetical protein
MPDPEVRGPSFDSVDRNCLFVQIVGVIMGIVGAALWLWKSFGSELDPQSARLGEWIAKIAFATAAAASWIRSHRDMWLREKPRPGGLPMLNAESKRLPAWLLGFSMVVFYFAMGAIATSASILVQALGANIIDSASNPSWTTQVSAASILVTSTYALLVARRRQTTNSGGWIDVAILLPALIALLSSALVLSSKAQPIDSYARGHTVETVVACLASLLTGIYAMILSSKLKPRDKWGRAQDTGWSTEKKRHA